MVDYQQRLSELESSRNPFATVVLAHLAALETWSDRKKRKESKLALVQKLYEQGFERREVLDLLAFIDWMLTLPLNLDLQFRQELELLEAGQRMKYVTSFERMGIEKGKQEGFLKGISLGLKLKFGSPGQDLLPEITAIQDVNTLEAILTAIDTVNTLEELRQIYQNAG